MYEVKRTMSWPEVVCCITTSVPLYSFGIRMDSNEFYAALEPPSSVDYDCYESGQILFHAQEYRFEFNLWFDDPEFQISGSIDRDEELPPLEEVREEFEEMFESGIQRVGEAYSQRGSDKIEGMAVPLRSYLSSDPKDDPRGPKSER